MKICLVSSSGGHLFQLYQLKSFWQGKKRFWVSFKTQDVTSLLDGERVFFAHYPESRNALNTIKNFFLAFDILRKERPEVIISCGAAIAPPFFLAGKILGIKSIYIEPVDFIKKPSLAGQLSYFLADLFLIQDKKQKKFFPKAHYWGATL